MDFFFKKSLFWADMARLGSIGLIPCSILASGQFAMFS